MRRLAVIAALAACPSPRAAQPPATPTPVAASPASADVPKRDALVRWSNVETVEGCFYFSGPFNGRDESLRGEALIKHDGTRVQLQLGPAQFDGTLVDGALEVKRTTQREHEGTWTVTETIIGTYEAGALHAKYRYEECGPNEPCPGRCTMTADMSSRPE